MQSLVGRSSVFELLASMPEAWTDDVALAHLAALCGLAGVEPAPVESARLAPIVLPEMPSAAPRIEPVAEPAPVVRPQVKFPRVVRYERIKDEEREIALPGDLDNASQLVDEEFAAPKSRRMPHFHTDGALIQEIAVGAGSHSMCLVLDGWSVALVDANNTVCIWDLRTKICQRTYRTEIGLVLSMKALHGGRYVLVMGDSSSIECIDLVTETSVEFYHGHNDSVSSMRVVDCAAELPNRHLILTGGWDGCIEVRRFHDWSLQSKIAVPTAAVRCLETANADQYVLCGGDEGDVYRIDIETGKIEIIMTAHKGGVRSIISYSDGWRALSAGEDATIRVWDIDTGACLQTLQGHSGSILSLCVLRDQLRAVSGGSDGSLRLWDLRTGNCLAVKHAHEGGVGTICLSTDGQVIISEGGGTVCSWNVQRIDPVLCMADLVTAQIRKYQVSGEHSLGETEGRLLEALVLAVLSLYPNQERTLGKLLSYFYTPDYDNDGYGLAELLSRNDNIVYPLLHPTAYETITSFLEARDAYKAGILTALGSYLEKRLEGRRDLRFSELIGSSGSPFNWAIPTSLSPPGLAPPPATPPTKIPLTPYSRLDPFLRKALGRTGASRAIDVPRVVRAAARVEPMRKLPRKLRRGWAPRATVLIDRDATLTPFWDDQSALLQRLRRQRGRAGLTELIVDDPRGAAWDVARNAPSDAHLKATERGTPVLLLGDCGFLRDDADRQHAWRAMGVRLRRHGCRTVAMAPCPPDRWEHDAFGAWLMALWDRNARLPVVDDRSPNGGFGPGSLKSDEPTGETPVGDRAGNLLALLAGAVRIEPALLRATRLMLRSGHADVGTEADAWTHPWIGAASTTAIALDPQQARALRANGLGNVPLSHPEQIHRDLLALFARHHAVHSPMILIEERLNLLEARGFGDNDPDRKDLLAGIGRIVRTLLDDEPLTEGRAAWVLRIVDRLSVTQRRQVPRLAAAYWRALGKLGRPRGEELLPKGFEYKDIGWLLDGEERRTRLWQVGSGFVLSPTRPGTPDVPAGSPIIDITTRVESLQFEGPRPDGRGHERRPIPVDGPVDIRFPATISSEFETWHLDEIERPSWASAIGRDKYGLWADLEVKGVVQRMRWINPGSFMMGSPEDEPGRSSDETQHQVNITYGYWLADTPCTQAFWEAVTGENPARFKTHDRPVESVSWKDCCDKFLARLPDLAGGDLVWALPSEAQWEYACRAGTEMALYSGPMEILGANNAPALDAIAWYGGNSGRGFELQNGRSSSLWEERQYTEDKSAGTHPVKQRRENPWGLYDMLGNVREWCADRYGPHNETETENSISPHGGDYRVLRGGSWIDFARLCRSAARPGRVPYVRHNYYSGFRFAQTQSRVDLSSDLTMEDAPWPSDSRSSNDAGIERRILDVICERVKQLCGPLKLPFGKHRNQRECPRGRVERGSGLSELRGIGKEEVGDIFEQSGRKLLILGEPAAGKTNIIFALWHYLFERRGADPRARVPIILELSRWRIDSHSLTEWVVKQLHELYDIPVGIVSPELGEELVRDGSFILLLDGLDEVEESQIDSCIREIKGHVSSASEFAISCRTSKYEILSRGGLPIEVGATILLD